ncbi:UNVERIFIED_CONTAM: hypothetical protein RMT77_008132 [Armadillidium vulgare]
MADNPQLVSYLYSEYLKPPSNLTYNFTYRYLSTVKAPFLLNMMFHNFLYDTFKDSDEPGFFVEAGALNGEVASNTLWLEYKKNWTGLLIEPNEVSCKSLQSKHRKAWTSCSCLAPKNYAVKSLFEYPDTNGVQYDSIWLFRANTRSIKSRFHIYKDRIQEKASFTYATAQCFPLLTYLLALNVTVIDLLSLDTQGGEKSVLLSFPFDKVKIKYMLVEYFKRGTSPTKRDEELILYLNKMGFDLINVSEGSGEYIFKNKEF